MKGENNRSEEQGAGRVVFASFLPVAHTSAFAQLVGD